MSDTNGIRDARVEMLARTVKALLGLLKREGGFAWPQDQELMRRARAQLVELGFRVNGEEL